MCVIRQDAVEWRGARGEAGEARGQVRAGVKAFVDKERLKTRKNWPANDRHSSSSRAVVTAFCKHSTLYDMLTAVLYTDRKCHQPGRRQSSQLAGHVYVQTTCSLYNYLEKKIMTTFIIALEQGTLILNVIKIL